VQIINICVQNENRGRPQEFGEWHGLTKWHDQQLRKKKDKEVLKVFFVGFLLTSSSLSFLGFITKVPPGDHFPFYCQFLFRCSSRENES
jgi:hypothetical protein